MANKNLFDSIHLSYGTNITTRETLEKITIAQSIAMIRDKNSNLADLTFILRSLYMISDESYRIKKKELPYIATSLFHPPIRRKENFAKTYSFLIDIDNLEHKDYTPETLKEILAKDPRVCVAYTSPSGNGLKVLFLLERPISEASLFSMFYKAFLAHFAKQHHLLDMVDFRTHDVSRVSFLCYDPDVYVNHNPQLVSPSDYVNFEEYKIQASLESEVNEVFTYVKENRTETKQELPQDVIQKIKKILEFGPSPAERKRIYVPEIFQECIPKLIEYLENLGMKIVHVKNIHYGQQIMVFADEKYAEVNLFYGKNGFKAVPTTRRGTDPEFAKLLKNLVLKKLTEMYGAY